MSHNAEVILIADDDQSLREYIAGELGKSDFEVVQAKSAKEAMAILRKQDVDVIIADNYMGDINGKSRKGGGLDLLQHVTEEWPEIILFVLTALKDLAIMDAASDEIGVAGYFSKTSVANDPSSLERSIRKALELQLSVEEIEEVMDADPSDVSFSQFDNLNSKHSIDLTLRGRKQLENFAQQALESKNLAWAVICGGEIAASSQFFDDLPSPKEIDDIGRKCGLVPFLFSRDEFSEEIGVNSPWAPTEIPADHYPSLPIIISNGSTSTEVVADFDTGSPAIHIDADHLSKKQVLLPEHIFELKKSGSFFTRTHLGKKFSFYLVDLQVAVPTPSGQVGAQMICHCVRNWAKSPFRKINMHRTALAGRRVITRLNLKVKLDGRGLETEVHDNP